MFANVLELVVKNSLGKVKRSSRPFQRKRVTIYADESISFMNGQMGN